MLHNNDEHSADAEQRIIILPRINYILVADSEPTFNVFTITVV